MQRNTKQRQIVMQTLAKMHNHPTASQLYEVIHQEYPTIGKATVFRILNQECEDGTIMRVLVNDDEMHYEMKNPPHYHMRCRVCSKVLDAPMEVHDMEKYLSSHDGFLIEGHTVEFYGVCEECQTNKTRM